ARRDAEWNRPVFEALGLTVGALQSQMADQDRARAYRCDITYGTSGEFGFDFLRDRVKVRDAEKEVAPFCSPWQGGPAADGTRGQPQANRLHDGRVQRGHHFALVDEADSILIDEARTPLIIATPTRLANEEEQVVFRWADRVARECQPSVDCR